MGHKFGLETRRENPWLDLGRFFSFLIYTQSVGLLERGIGPSQGRYLHTEQHKHRINANRHPCLEWDSNPRSQWAKTIYASDRAATVTVCVRITSISYRNRVLGVNWIHMAQDATSRKVARSSPDEVDFFNLPNPSSSTMALGSTQPLI
jgi:hypothetical protein